MEKIYLTSNKDSWVIVQKDWLYPDEKAKNFIINEIPVERHTIRIRIFKSTVMYPCKKLAPRPLATTSKVATPTACTLRIAALW